MFGEVVEELHLREIDFTPRDMEAIRVFVFIGVLLGVNPARLADAAVRKMIRDAIRDIPVSEPEPACA